ncbi:MAG: choice-of-anchor D domain-containing protein, partial [Acidobacteriota bacterium]|nr:choice-of-anchor D domain-containing protein [Acidobacteriota bacterium]
MKARILFLLALAPALLQAQIVLYSLDGITPSPLGAVYGYGQVAAGDTKIVRFRALNTGTASITITLLKVLNNTGAGFSIVNSSSTPFVVAPGSAMDFFAGFSATDVASYSATLEVGTVSQTVTAILLATVVPAPTLSVSAPCTGPDANLTISFGRIPQGTQESCTLSILNPFTQALTVSPLTLTGAGFSTAAGSAVTIAAGQSSSFTILFAPTNATAYTATLTVGTRTYTLSGTGFSSPLPALVWSFDSTAIASGEQHTLSLQLSAPAPVTAAGTLTLTFTPSTTIVTDDAMVRFLPTSKRVASFTVAAGATSLTINALPNIVFSTGTTAGTLTFTVDPGIFGLSGSPARSLTTPPALIAISSRGATSLANELDVVIAGFDNTYSMGALSFA